jgi:hypothetical protein
MIDVCPAPFYAGKGLAIHEWFRLVWLKSFLSDISPEIENA